MGGDASGSDPSRRQRPPLTSPPPPKKKPQAPLVGSAAPDFTAQAVLDQEFVDMTLSQYKVKNI